MKFFKASTRLKPLHLEGDLDVSTMNVDAHQSLLAIKQIHVDAEIQGMKDIYEARVNVEAKVVLECAYTLEPIDYHLKFSDVITFSDVESEDEYLMYAPGNEIELDPYIFGLLLVEVPTKIVKKGAKRPLGGDGYRVLSEKEFEQERSSKTDPRFDVLEQLDFEEDE